MKHLSKEELESGLDHIKESPANHGEIMMIVRRPEIGKREVLQECELDLELGLVGDNWKTRGSSRTNDGFGHPDMQLNIMNARAIDLVAVEKERWALAGDQFYIDLDLSDENLPPGTRLSLGDAVIEVTAIPHTGCKKFVERFGIEAMKFVNSEQGKKLHLRGINAKVVESGVVCVGELVFKIV
ncbi:MAG: MOSC domain-containing protein [Pyrinomonadaceae bacterium]|nr:MOSC domain-containing protein [Pyrinomonadaceae bacterium]